MRTSHLLTALALGAALCSPELVAHAAAPGKGKNKVTGANAASDLTVLHALHKTNRLIEKADPIYMGHRVKAMHEINAAIGKLEKEAARHGLKVPNQKHAKEPVPASNAQIKQAQSDLTTILAALNGLPKTKLRGKAAGHVQTAIGELGLALASAKANQK